MLSKTQNLSMNSQVEILKSNVTTPLAESGSPLGKEMTELIKKANEAAVAFTEWSKTHPEITTGVLKTSLAVGGRTAAVGAVQIAVAALSKVWLLLAANPAALWVMGVGATIYGLNKAAPYIPGTDAYADRKLDERYNLYTKAPAELRQIPTTIGQAPDSRSPVSADGSQVGREFAVRQALLRHDTGLHPSADNHQYLPPRCPGGTREVGRVVNQPTSTKYINSQHPVPVME